MLKAPGLMAGYFASMLTQDEKPVLPPRTTAFGSMLAHLSDTTDIEHYQPMNINFGLFPDLPVQVTAKGRYRKLKGMERKEAYCQRALTDLEAWLDGIKCV